MDDSHLPDDASQPSQPALDAANEALAEMRLSFDSSPGAQSPPAAHVNGFLDKGVANGNGHTEKMAPGGSAAADTVQSMRDELLRTKQENETLTMKYSNLVAKLTTMRNTVESKLKADAEELDRREQLVQQLTAQNEDLGSTIETLKDELIVSNSEAEKSSRELESLRNRALQDSALEAAAREREMLELQGSLERCRVERDEWERALLEERVVADEAKAALASSRRELALEKEARSREADELQRERERSVNLQSVLEDFQSAKEHETRQAVREYVAQLQQTTQSLAEFKSRALRAEVELQESSTNTQRTAALEKELKEKNLLIGKLRHEAVILNEHLTEAIRRLRKGASDTNVDRRLVTNVVLSFLATPRADSKRFEILSLLASVLSWTDSEREKAGLQRTTGVASSLLGRASGKGKTPELEKTDETESFSKMWVEFLLKEAAQGTAPTNYTPTPTPTTGRNNSLPNSPLFSPGGSPYQKLGRMPSHNGSSFPQRSSVDHPGPPPNSHSQSSLPHETP
ncbi:hypothetical protein JB92DRAFT_3047338 [Gautieria morchelliformis]|nr:hypothetical protein JB92DRAFT_3047338 [Gautieria morchelliformis]